MDWRLCGASPGQPCFVTIATLRSRQFLECDKLRLRMQLNEAGRFRLAAFINIMSVVQESCHLFYIVLATRRLTWLMLRFRLGHRCLGRADGPISYHEVY